MNRFVVFVRFVLRCEFAADSGFARGQFVDQRCIAWPLVISKSFKQCPKEKFRICDTLVIPLVAQIDHIIEPNDDLSNLRSKPSECRHLSWAHAHADTKNEVSAPERFRTEWVWLKIGDITSCKRMIFRDHTNRVLSKYDRRLQPFGQRRQFLHCLPSNHTL